MSRYDFTGKAGATTVSLGWDRPLATFFVQVFRPDPEADGEEHAFIWQGSMPGELPKAADAIRLAEPYAHLPPDLGATLETDRLKTLGQQDGKAQRAAKRWLIDPEQEE